MEPVLSKQATHEEFKETSKEKRAARETCAALLSSPSHTFLSPSSPSSEPAQQSHDSGAGYYFTRYIRFSNKIVL